MKATYAIYYSRNFSTRTEAREFAKSLKYPYNVGRSKNPTEINYFLLVDLEKGLEEIPTEYQNEYFEDFIEEEWADA